jgi:hypothetical protein
MTAVAAQARKSTSTPDSVGRSARNASAMRPTATRCSCRPWARCSAERYRASRCQRTADCGWSNVYTVQARSSPPRSQTSAVAAHSRCPVTTPAEQFLLAREVLVQGPGR